MFVYLSKKIAIPNSARLLCLSWNSEQSWIACGGEKGLLKVLQLSKEKGATSNLSMNQTLEGHSGNVVCVTWNENYRKLTTSDASGLIIVWMLHKGMWFEEMINNRNKSVVRDMKWTADGQKICIVYEDGAVIVGSVDGNRLWGKELKSQLALVEWSPDGRMILFCTTNGEVHVYDNLGNFLQKVPILCLDDQLGVVPLAGVQWYAGSRSQPDPTVPQLAVAYQNGRIQLMLNESDDNPVLIGTGIRTTCISWNPLGDVFAVVGTQMQQVQGGGEKEIGVVQFYSPLGQHLRTLKVPGGNLNSISWEGNGLRVALAVESSIYFANIRPDYKWGYCANSVVYAYTKPDRPEHCVVFWDTLSEEKFTKYVRKLLHIQAYGEYCCLATKGEDNTSQCVLILCNAIGSPIDSKYLDFEPTYLAITKTHVVAASEDTIYVWQFRTAVKVASAMEQSISAGLKREKGREKMFHIDELPTANGQDKEKYVKPAHETNDPISCITASETCLIVARHSGILQKYTLPHLSLEAKLMVPCRPQVLAINCNSTRVSIIDINGTMTLFDMEARSANGAPGALLDMERKDVWDMRWADDNSELLAIMEKTRMYIFRGTDPEEPVLSSGFLCEFTDLQIKSVLLDDIMRTPELPEKDMVQSFETKSLRDTRDILAQVNNLKDAHQYAEDNPHPRLWRLLAEAALEQLDFTVADKAFVRCQDYQGIQFVKRLKVLDDKIKQRAEVAAYFKRFDEAENLYREIDRKDLALELRMRLGDWFRVIQLVQAGAGNDELLTTAWNKIGDYYADRQKWSKAVQYYAQAQNNEALIETYYILEDYEGMEKLISVLPDGSALLSLVGDKFTSVGMCEHAVRAHMKGGNVKAAIDACVLLNQWNQAVELAEKHNFQQIEGLLSKYASHLLEKKKTVQAIELYRKANRNTEAAKLLSNLGKEVGKTKADPRRAKKLFVMAAMEVERYKKRVLDAQITSSGTMTTAQTLDSLITADQATSSDRALENPWRGAEAYHFYMLAQRQLYEGALDACVRTAIRLQEYEDVLDTQDVFSLIALTTYYSKFFKQCSRAFIKLEGIEELPATDKQHFQDLALAIFTRNNPSDPNSRQYNCPGRSCTATVADWQTYCSSCGYHFPACVATGRSILDRNYYTCKGCKHKAVESELRGLRNCPLCHTRLLV